LIYVDTSALLKLVKDDETERPSLRAYLGRDRTPTQSSTAAAPNAAE
jgi:uncharacterized protein with PIN domain